MRTLLMIVALACTACGTAPDQSKAVAAKPVDPRAVVSVSLPSEPANPFPGEGGALIEQSCVACHSPEMIANQPALDAVKWQATIDKMRAVYKAEIDQANDAALVAALIATRAEQPATR